MPTTFLSLATSATMFPANCNIAVEEMFPQHVREIIEELPVVSALNVSHASTIDAVKRRYSIVLPLPQGSDAPKVALVPGDRLIIVQAAFKRRLAQGEQYSDEEVAATPISFKSWRVIADVPCGRCQTGIAATTLCANCRVLFCNNCGMLTISGFYACDQCSDHYDIVYDASLVTWNTWYTTVRGEGIAIYNGEDPYKAAIAQTLAKLHGYPVPE